MSGALRYNKPLFSQWDLDLSTRRTAFHVSNTALFSEEVKRKKKEEAGGGGGWGPKMSGRCL